MGNNLSRWTITYFAVAITWLLAAEVLMVIGFGAPSADVASPDTLVLVHVVCIGWLSMALCGRPVPVRAGARRQTALL